jgi:hypothetical protein
MELESGAERRGRVFVSLLRKRRFAVFIPEIGGIGVRGRRPHAARGRRDESHEKYEEPVPP